MFNRVFITSLMAFMVSACSAQEDLRVPYFESVEAFEAAVAEANDGQDFLSPSGEVLIDDKLFQMDYEKETVTVHEPTGEVNVFGFEDDVLSAIFGGTHVADAAKGTYCNSRTVDGKLIDPLTGREVTFMIKYGTYGIYYELKAKLSKGWNWNGTELLITFVGDWVNRKKSGYFDLEGNTTGQHLTVNAYSSTRRLKDYHSDAYFMVGSVGAWATKAAYNDCVK